MTTYVYDLAGSGACFYIDGNYVYPLSGGTGPTYWISGGHWYDHPPKSPKFYVSGKYIYPYPLSGRPKYYLL